MRTRSPFPGMDPWLERYWSSVHHRLISHFADQIQSQLPDGLFADIEITVYINDEGENSANMIPDVSLFESGTSRQSSSMPESRSGSAVATPYRIKIPAEPIEQGSVVIRSLEGNQPLVTAIEVLSPANKVNRNGRDTYLAKREQYYQSSANVVEVDLIRRGESLVDVPLDKVPEQLITPYKAVVRRAYPKDWTEAEYYTIPLREKLPTIAIPLRRRDPDVILNFQAAIDHAYEGGRYSTRIDYKKPPFPSLSQDDAAWAKTLIENQ